MPRVVQAHPDPINQHLRRVFAKASTRALAASVLATGCFAQSADELSALAPSEPDYDAARARELSQSARSDESFEAATRVADVASTARDWSSLTSQPSCEGTAWRPLLAVAPTVAPQYLAWRNGLNVLHQVGVRCSGAEDPRVCEASIRQFDVQW